VKHSILELPRLSAKLFDELITQGISEVSQVPDDTLLNSRHKIVWESVKTGEPVVDAATVRKMLGTIQWPAYYLDFESAASVFPLYPNTGPYEQIPTQFSIHTCNHPGNIVKHAEFLADPSRDCRRQLTDELLSALGEAGSIIVYSPFEGRVFKSLAAHIPELRPRLEGLAVRLFDLERVFARAYYHPEFHGRTSIKQTLPAMVDLSYDNLEIADGDSAVAAFVMLARGAVPQDDVQSIREQLLKYCATDTEAMVKLHLALVQAVD